MAPTAPQRPAAERVEGLLEAALAAHRNGTLDDLLAQRPRVARWLVRRHVRWARETADDALERGGSPLLATATVLLRWLVTQLRPDQQPSLDGIDRDAWINLTSWRPMLAVMCHAGLAEVPEFRDRYRRRLDEPAVDNLCGLWGVGVSTFYRYLERGKRSMAQIALEPAIGVPRRLSLRRLVEADAVLRHGLDARGLALWHRRHSTSALARGDAASALWHQLQVGDGAAFVATLRAHAATLAGEPDTDALVERLAATTLDTGTLFELWMARALLSRTRNAAEREQQAYERALQIANTAGNRVLLGIAYGALGKFYEPRDGNRAFACYEDSAEFLRDAAPGDTVAAAHYVTTLVRLAWLYAMRNDPRSRAVLDRAESLRGGLVIADDVLGMLEQTWGEYWRRAGELRKALDHKYRALNIFERLADQRSVLVTYLNLSSIHAETQEFARAIDYAQRILELAARQVVEPEIVASTHLNLGATYYWQDRLDAAIEQYQLALDCSLQARLRLQANRAHYNLAEAYYKRFQIAGDAEDERRGDLHAAASIHAPLAETTQALVEASRTLKAEVLGDQAGPAKDRLLPEESAVHFDDMAEVQRQRAVLAVPMSPEAHVRARLAIAAAYLAISVKEREAARQLIERHGLGATFASAIGQLRDTFERDLSQEHRLMARWQDQAGDLLDEPRRAKLIGHLTRDGFINKSGYGALCDVSAATASKHLVTLAERGLLKQTGKGPSTRYQLPG